MRQAHEALPVQLQALLEMREHIGAAVADADPPLALRAPTDCRYGLFPHCRFGPPPRRLRPGLALLRSRRGQTTLLQRLEQAPLLPHPLLAGPDHLMRQAKYLAGGSHHQARVGHEPPAVAVADRTQPGQAVPVRQVHQHVIVNGQNRFIRRTGERDHLVAMLLRDHRVRHLLRVEQPIRRLRLPKRLRLQGDIPAAALRHRRSHLHGPLSPPGVTQLHPTKLRLGPFPWVQHHHPPLTLYCSGFVRFTHARGMWVKVRVLGCFSQEAVGRHRRNSADRDGRTNREAARPAGDSSARPSSR